MSPITVSDDPSPEQMRAEARDLARAVRSGDPRAAQLLARHGLAAPDPGRQLAPEQAMHVVAREHGFQDWSRLLRYLDLVAEYGRRLAPDDPGDAPAGAFCRAACLTYTAQDGPARWAQAARILAERPHLPREDVHAAAAAADADAVRAHLRADPRLARTRGGPHDWTPLFQVAYSRVAAGGDPVEVARLLLDAGADPNEGYLFNGLPTPFTVLTGVFGAGELGTAHQPPHPRAAELAGLLLAAGADADDAQTLYNRQFDADDRHLELLLAHGLATAERGVWARRLAEVADDPRRLLRAQLRWAVDHGMTARVHLLARSGVDVAAPFDDGPTPADQARLAGHPQLATALEGLAGPLPGPLPGTPGGVPELVAALLTADAAAAARITAARPGVLAEVRQRRPGLLVWAAANGRTSAVELLLDHGFDVDALGRGDQPAEQPWESALHVAAGHGDVATARVLLRRGADPSLRDARFDATPLSWARHFGHDEVARLIEAHGAAARPDPTGAPDEFRTST